MFAHLRPFFDAAYRRPDTVVALRNRHADFEPGEQPVGREIVEVDLPGTVNRRLLGGWFNDVTTSRGGRWIVAGRAGQGFTIIAPDGDVGVVSGPDARRIVDLDW